MTDDLCVSVSVCVNEVKIQFHTNGWFSVDENRSFVQLQLESLTLKLHWVTADS